MSEKLLQNFRAEAERLVPVPDLYSLRARGQRRRRALIGAGALAIATVLGVSGVVVAQTLGQQRAVSPAQHTPASPSPLPTVGLTTRDAYVERNDAICRIAHAKLNAQLLAEGYNLEVSPNDDGSGIEMQPTDDDAMRTYRYEAAPILQDARNELLSVAPPTSARADFEKAYRALDRIISALGYGGTMYRSIHFIEGPEFGLHHCTLNFPR